MFTSPSQILCTIFGIKIYFYGVIMALAISIGVLVSDFIAYKFYDFKKETIIDLAPYLIVFGILGARFYYCALNSDFYLRFPTEILAIRHGGISIHGAIIGGIVGLLIFAKRRNLDYKKLLDVTAVGLPLAQAIGRWGNFFNSEAFGGPCNLPWKLYIAPQYRPIPFQEVQFFHPTFLYESMLDFILFIFLFYLAKKNFIKKDGNLALIYLILYSIIRIFVESLRIDSVKYVFGFPVAIFVSICIIILSTILLMFRKGGRYEIK